MTVGPREHGFRAPNYPARVGHEHTQVVKSPGPNHEYRSRTRRLGEAAEFCTPCIKQQQMAQRWKNIRKAFMTIRSSTRKSSAAEKAASVSGSKEPVGVSFRAAGPAISLEGVRVLVVLDLRIGERRRCRW